MIKQMLKGLTQWRHILHINIYIYNTNGLLYYMNIEYIIQIMYI